MSKQFNEERIFSTSSAGTTEYPSKKKKKRILDPYFIPNTKPDSKWVINLNVRTRTIELL